MLSIAQRIVGRYVETNGQGDMTISITKVYNGIQPFEVLIKRKYDDIRGPAVIQRVVVDLVEPNVCQGQNIGRHGEPGSMETFTDKKIKDCILKLDSNQHTVVFKEYKYPSSIEDIEKRSLMFTSVYTFSPTQDGGMDLQLLVHDADGQEIKLENFRRVDTTQRNYSVTFDKTNRYI